MTDQQTQLERGVQTQKRLRRSTDDKVVGGVCGGLAEYFGIDPVWLRVAFVALVFAGAGSGVVLYLIGWIAIPERGADEPVHEATDHAKVQGTLVVGVALIAIGVISLVNLAIPWVDRLFWPGVIVAIGVGLLWGGGRRDNAD